MTTIIAAVSIIEVILLVVLFSKDYRVRWPNLDQCRLMGGFLDAGHILLFACVTSLTFFANEPDWPIYWILVWGLDFPVTILYFVIGAVLPHFPDVALVHNAASPLNDLNNFLVPLIFTSTIGTAWWYFVPRLLVRVSKLIRR